MKAKKPFIIASVLLACGGNIVCGCVGFSPWFDVLYGCTNIASVAYMVQKFFSVLFFFKSDLNLIHVYSDKKCSYAGVCFFLRGCQVYQGFCY